MKPMNAFMPILMTILVNMTIAVGIFFGFPLMNLLLVIVFGTFIEITQWLIYVNADRSSIKK